MAKARNYRKEYDNYQGKPVQKKNRAARNGARRIAMAAGKVSKGDGKDVAHKKALIKGGSKTAKSNNLSLLIVALNVPRKPE